MPSPQQRSASWSAGILTPACIHWSTRNPPTVRMRLEEADSTPCTISVSTIPKGRPYSTMHFWMSLRRLKQQKKCPRGCKMAGAVRCPNLVPGYKGNGCRGHKWILVFLKPKELVKGLIKGLVKGKAVFAVMNEWINWPLIASYS